MKYIYNILNYEYIMFNFCVFQQNKNYAYNFFSFHNYKLFYKVIAES